MGLIDRFLDFLLGGGSAALRETATIFRENAESKGVRLTETQLATLAQHGAEFERSEKGAFDKLMDGVNRLPRPLLALGTLGLFLSAMVAPIWFSERMQGLALVPEPLWWLLGVIVSFYFGARHQAKSQDFQRELAATVARVPAVVGTIAELQELRDLPEPTNDGEENAALDDWRKMRAAE